MWNEMRPFEIFHERVRPTSEKPIAWWLEHSSGMWLTQVQLPIPNQRLESGSPISHVSTLATGLLAILGLRLFFSRHSILDLYNLPVKINMLPQNMLFFDKTAFFNRKSVVKNFLTSSALFSLGTAKPRILCVVLISLALERYRKTRDNTKMDNKNDMEISQSETKRAKCIYSRQERTQEDMITIHK